MGLVQALFRPFFATPEDPPDAVKALPDAEQDLSRPLSATPEDAPDAVKVVPDAELERMKNLLQKKQAELKECNPFNGRSYQAHLKLAEEVDDLKNALQIAQFQRENKTSFAADDVRAVLQVTSGLQVPTEPLEALPTAEHIDTLIAKHYSGQKRANATVGRLVDAGGKHSHSAEERTLRDAHRHGFIAAVTAAFAKHYPLLLRPQHFWLLVTQAVATHVELNAERVREQWVTHEGKKTLTVKCDDFVFGKTNDWASVVSGRDDSFSVQIASNTVAGVAEALSPDFSSTTPAEDIAQKIVVMDVCKQYFSYKCCTMCGFPEITLDGTEEDWLLLRNACTRLIERCEPGFAANWAKSLIPLLDKLAAARAGEVDARFWNSMCKRGGTSGSGSRTWFNGWINIFFPYIDKRINKYCVPYSPSNGYVLEGLQEKFYGMHERPGYGGPDCADFGSGMSKAPVTWDYNGNQILLDFNAGFTGAGQDQNTLQIRPQVSWFITLSVTEEEHPASPFDF